MKTFRHSLLWLSCSILFSTVCYGTQLTGTVKSKDGRPLRGVRIYSHDDRGIEAPKDGRRFYEETDRRGRFTIRNHGRVIYFSHPGFQPFSRIVEYSTRRVSVVLEPPHDTWVVPSCDRSADYQQHKDEYVEMYRWVFLPLPRSVEVKMENGDDYQHYAFTFESGEKKSSLEGWFGLQTSGLEHSAESLLKSVNVNERWAKLGDYQAWDTYGQTTDGKHWRYLNLDTNGISYEDATKETAAVFEDMLRRLCYRQGNDDPSH